MKSKKDKTVSLMGFVASLLTIFAFVTGIYSLPALFTASRLPPLAEVGHPTFSYGVLIISQTVFFFSYFIATRFLYKKVLIGYLQLDDHSTEVFSLLVFTLLGLGISFLFAEAFWGPVSRWEWEHGPNLQAAFLGVSLVAHVFTAKCAVECV